ncbi:MAG: helix-turn-helix domain-containing protein [Bacteroidia bacterium]|nr:helix-turn-helix domain-containing protein [Bacteroidia bacterium]
MELIYKFGAYHGIFLGIILFNYQREGKTISNRILGTVILFFSLCLLEWLSYSTGFAEEYPHVFLASNPLLYAIAPLLYLYVESYLDRAFRFDGKALALSLAPGLLYMLFASPFYFSSADEKLQIIQQGKLLEYIIGGETWSLFYVLLVVGFCVYSLKRLGKLEESDPPGAARRIWLKRIIWAYILFALLGFADWGIAQYFPALNVPRGLITLSIQTLIIHATAYLAIINPQALLSFEQDFIQKKEEKYQKSQLDEGKSQLLTEEIRNILKDKDIYLDMDLSPAYFAQKLGISKHQLSQLLNQKMETSFSDLINSYRIEEAKRLIREEGNEKLKLLHLAFDSGFNNKTTFLRNFKKFAGMTPALYRESLKK